RIYEGTNEINRMLLVGMILKRAMKGELNIMEPAMAVSKELTSVPSFESPDLSKLFAEEKMVLKNLKKAVLMVAGKAAQSFGPKLDEEQEILMNIADMLIEIYASESALLRAEKLMSIKGEEACNLQINAAKVYFHDAIDKINKAGREAIVSFTSGDEQKVMLMGMKRYTKINPINPKQLRREIADVIISKNQYIF
ncbi:MAG: hypothetical protein ACJA2S_002938, partial [Cyclobacteriaceae bacterium]